MNKKRLLLIALSSLLLSEVWSQASIQLNSNNGPLVNGGEILFDAEPQDWAEHMYDFYITNNTGSTQNWLITRKILAQPSDWSNYISWGGICYPTSPNTMWSSLTATMEDSQTETLNTYSHTPTAGSAHYRYYVSSDGINFVDSVDIVVEASLPTSISTIDKSKFEIYPNPATTSIQISSYLASPTELNLYNLSGKLVLFDLIDSQLDKQIDLSKLEPGCYIYVLGNRGSKLQEQGKLIIGK